MSNDNNKTDIEQAVEKVNPTEVKENLNSSDSKNTNSANLSKNEDTPFIDDELRTDK